MVGGWYTSHLQNSDYMWGERKGKSCGKTHTWSGW